MLHTILNVVLWLLSFLGIMLLIILGIIIAALLVVLFVPIRYKGDCSKNSVKTQAQIRINWLLHIIRVYVDYEKKLVIKAYVLFIKIYDSGKPGQKKSKKNKQLKNVKEAKEEKEEKEEKEADKTLEDNPGETIDANISKQAGRENVKKKKQSLFEKIRNIFKNIICKCKAVCDKIKSIVNNINYYCTILKEEKTREIFGRVIHRLIKVLKSIRPRKLKANITVGTGSPDTTGYLMALAGMMYPCLGKNVNIEADFDNTILHGDIKFKGRITLFIIIAQVLKIYTDREIRILISRLKREDA